MRKDVVLIYDIGKTNKKILLFDEGLQVLHEEETAFAEIPDDDGFKGDDADQLEAWILESCRNFLEDPAYHVRGINFTTYGATLMYLDKDGKRLTPIYNYLKPMPEGIVEPVYEKYGGRDEFCRQTASPALGMLNSGFQALWLKETKPEIFGKVDCVLHFPQYLSHLLTGRLGSEHTSIGCHTAMWDFDKMKYHDWTRTLGNVLPHPGPVETTHPSTRFGRTVPVGIGIHDSSSSLVPYFMKSDEPFILVSTGTWCISMNPFNPTPLTPEQLQRDCLAYLSVQQKPVKSSRLFLGHIHDENVRRLTRSFGLGEDAYKQVTPDERLLGVPGKKSPGTRVFFRNGVPGNYVDETVRPEDFGTFGEAYHQLMADLVDLTAESIGLITGSTDLTRNLYITGGFSKNPLFLTGIARRYPDKNVYTSEVPNATSLGAALILWKALEPGRIGEIDLGLKLSRP
jgi:sugar (pentulose or hexulose) kinase